MSRVYKALNRQIFSLENFSLVPIRETDRYDIMRWRNEQIYHLRQNKPITKQDQDYYFNTVIDNLFEQDQPQQILFSYLQDDTCVGYGGLVHINWNDRNAELSFIMDTQLERNDFDFHWSNFLYLIEKVGFKELGLHKLYTYAFDVRPKLYAILQTNYFIKEAELREHCIVNNQFRSVIIHSKWNHS